MDNIVCKDCGHIITAREAALSGKCFICGGIYTIQPFRSKTESGAQLPCSDGLSAKDDEIKRLKTLLNPRMWGQEMHKAWHGNLPDIQASFDALKECGR